ncbi:DNA ligase [Vibrio phage JSF12]|uniref:DNA ligase n=2 Tax=Jesfedecavirus TaxID=2560156 RepID=A0A2D0YLS8_9CAUD|nr:NAD-dependent DNA ligase [Vibrio phage JSF10]YP_009794824.1 NAD-dependent DNA ligase [Vibrio phage JSF12]ASV43440.1 DNA ligase [Vibrio phage JSF10]ASV43659.1 DNA ligase [Vibrio phage JSF12]
MKLIQIPTECPSCQSKLVKVNGQLFCRSTSCPAQSSKLVENFCKKNKIKGFGEKTVAKLGLSSIPELLNLTEHTLIDTLGEKVGSKLFLEVQSIKNLTFAQVLGSLGINLIGTVAAEKVAVICGDFTEITPQNLATAGLGEKATQSLTSWVNSLDGQDTIEAFSSFMVFEANTTGSRSEEFAVNYEPVDICITGSLLDFKSRSEAAAYLKQFGITVKDSVTKTVKYLVCEDEKKTSSSSYKKAQAAGIPILSIKNLLERLNNV